MWEFFEDVLGPVDEENAQDEKPPEEKRSVRKSLTGGVEVRVWRSICASVYEKIIAGLFVSPGVDDGYDGDVFGRMFRLQSVLVRFRLS